MTQKSANIYARIEPDIKKQAEDILSSLGVSASSAINMFYKQIIYNNGIPFEVKLPSSKPLAMGSLTKEQLDEEIGKGYTEMLEGKGRAADKVFADIRKDNGL